MSDRPHVRVEVADGVAVLTLDRPEVRNAFSGRMARELGDAYRACDAADDVRAVVLTGTPPAFCAGADMSSGGDTFERRDDASFSAAGVDPPAWEVRKPVIAAVNGHAVGIGLTLALQCDLRFVAADATYGVVQVRRGVLPDAYSHWTLPRIAGLAAAADVLLTGRLFDGREAKELGLASRCLPDVEVLPEALAVARSIATDVAPLSAALSKRLLWRSLGCTAAEVGELETALHHHVMGRADAVRASRPSSSAGRRSGSCGSLATGPTGSRAHQPEHGVHQRRLVVLPAPARVHHEVEVHVGPQDGPEQVEQQRVEIGPDRFLDGTGHLRPTPAFELDPPTLDLTVARGRLQQRPPHAGRPLVTCGHRADDGPQALLLRAAPGRFGHRRRGDEGVEHRPQDLLLRAEPGVDRLHRHTRPRGQRSQRGARPSGRGEQPAGGVDDVLPRLRRLLRPALRRVRSPLRHAPTLERRLLHCSDARFTGRPFRRMAATR